MAFDYNGSDNNLIIGGIAITGLASEDDAVSISYESDRTDDRPDLDGEVTRWFSNDFRADVTITLELASASNAYLSSLEQADRLTKTGSVSFLFTTAGGSSFTAENCWVKTVPDFSGGVAPTQLAWVIRCDRLIPTIVN